METFLEQVHMILPVLGLSLLQPRPTATLEFTVEAVTVGDVSTVSPPFVLTGSGLNATGQEIRGEFVVFKGSTARKHGVKSWAAYRALREQLEKDHKLIETADAEYLEFSEDVPFGSPSAAAVAVLARNANGRTEWKVRDTGQTCKQWYEQKLRDVIPEPTKDDG